MIGLLQNLILVVVPFLAIITLIVTVHDSIAETVTELLRQLAGSD